MKAPFQGGCLCGAVRFTCSAAPKGTPVCHCRDCQRFTGAPFAANLFVAADAVTFSGEVHSFTVEGDSGNTVTRCFCPTCGSPARLEAEAAPGFVILPLGAVDVVEGYAPSVELWTEHQLAPFCVQGEVKRFARNPPPRPRS